MKFISLFFFIIIISCGYTDIDSVPNFDNLQITNEDSIELCKISKKKNIDLVNCLVPYVKDLQSFQTLDINEENYIKLCNIIFKNNSKLTKCLSSFYEKRN